MNNNQNSQNDLKRSLFLITVAVIFGKCYFVVVTDAPFTGFTRALGANDLIYSIIAALPFIGGVLQIFASYMLESTGKRKFIFLLSGYVHRLIWIPIVLIPLIIPMNYKALTLWLVTALMVIYSIANSVVSISYLSWMGALIPPEVKGSFFGKRMALSTITGIIVGVGAGMFLDGSNSLARFAVIFVIAALLGATDTTCFIWVKDPPMSSKQKDASFIQLLLEPFKNNNYVKLILFISFWNFGFNFAAPFFNIYMIEQLKMSYFAISIFAQLMGSISTILFINHLGKLSDKYGNKPIIAVSCFFIALLPLLWCLATPANYPIIMSVIFFLTGLFQSGIQLTVNNLSIWLAPSQNRSMFLANFTLITSLASAAAYICGGSFMEFSKTFISSLHLSFLNGQQLSSFHVLFIISCILRFTALVVFLPRVTEKDSKSVGQLLRSTKILFSSKA